jgi:hypothetical protein
MARHMSFLRTNPSSLFRCRLSPAVFSDADIAEALTFVRRHFGKGASAVTAEQVAAQRQKHRLARRRLAGPPDERRR